MDAIADHLIDFPPMIPATFLTVLGALLANDSRPTPSQSICAAPGPYVLPH